MKFRRSIISMACPMYAINTYSNIKNRKICAAVKELLDKIKTRSSKMSNVSSEHP